MRSKNILKSPTLYSIPLFGLLLFSGVLIGQSFTFDHDTLYVNGPVDNLEIIAYNNITNNTADSLTINWKRTELSLTGGWKTQVCDLNFCWEFAVSSGQFQMDNARPANIDLHFWPEGRSGDAQVEVLLWVEGDSANTAQKAVYYGETWAVGIEEQSIDFNAISLFPNPVIDKLNFSGIPSDFSGEVQVLNILGNKVAAANINGYSNRSIELAELPKGLYIFAVTDVNGKTLGSKTFHKQQ